MATYSKTPAGRLLAFNPLSDLPLSLKNLLRSINGRADVRQLSEYLGTPTDLLLSALSELETRGLVKKEAAGWRRSEGAPESASDSPNHLRLVADSRYGPSRGDTVPSELTASKRAAKQTAREALHLDEVKDRMRQFVSTRLPQHAPTVLSELETIDNFEQLAWMLDAYAYLAKDAGPAGAQHIQDVRAIAVSGGR
jgi:hypothetical protein